MEKWLAIGKVVAKIVSVIPMVVNVVERLAGDKKGKDKQDAAIDGISTFISGLELAFGKELMDNNEFQIIVRKLIDDYVAAMNFAKKFKENLEDAN